MVVVDTSIIIDHLRLQSKDNSESLLIRLFRNLEQEDFALSIITIQELYTGKSSKQTKQEDYLLTTITPFKILRYSYEIAELAGEISRDNDHYLEFADSAIAATAIFNNAKLATLNRKHFGNILQLELLEIS